MYILPPSFFAAAEVHGVHASDDDGLGRQKIYIDINIYEYLYILPPSFLAAAEAHGVHASDDDEVGRSSRDEGTGQEVESILSKLIMCASMIIIRACIRENEKIYMFGTTTSISITHNMYLYVYLNICIYIGR